MKRFTLILVTVFCLATAAVNAQTYVGDIDDGSFGCISGAFTTNGHPYVFFESEDGSGYSIYQSDFTTHVIDIHVGYISSYYIDFDNGSQTYALGFTQNLFNTDDAFEYIEIEGPAYSPLTINIKSSNGNTLWSFNPEEGFLYDNHWVFKLDNKYYLLISEYREIGYEEYEFRYHLYFISQGQGLTEVKTELPISVFPSIAHRNQQITVELGEGNNATEVTVVNSLGQVIKRMPVEEGQRQITIPAQELNSGLNVLNTRTQQGQGSCKIIVQ